MLSFNDLRIETELQAYDRALKAEKFLSILTDVKPTTLSVKVADKPALFRLLEDNEACIEQVHIGTVDERYIASAVLKQQFKDLRILKILQRRPNSNDHLGLDSIDYLVTDLEETFDSLKNTGAAVDRERNPMHDWLSLRFGDDGRFEAKFTDHLVLAVARQELEFAEQNLLNL